MLNSGKKIRLGATKTINILTLVLSEKKFLKETKNQNPPPPPPPLQVKWSVPKNMGLDSKLCQIILSPVLTKYAHELMTAKQNSNNRHLTF